MPGYFPLGFGLTMYSILEAYAWQLRKSVLTSFLREMLFRHYFCTGHSFLCSLDIPNFDLFIKLVFTDLYFTGAHISGILISGREKFT